MKMENEFFKKAQNIVNDMAACRQGNQHHYIASLGRDSTVLEHTDLVCEAVAEIAPATTSAILTTVAYFHDCGKPAKKIYNPEKGLYQFIGHADESERIFRGMRDDFEFLSDEEFEQCAVLISTHESVGGRKAIRKYYNTYGDYLTRLHLVFRYCDIMGQNPEFAEPKLKELEEAWVVFEELREADL